MEILPIHLEDLITIVFSLYFISFCMLLLRHVIDPLERFNSKSDRSAMERFFYFIFTFYFLLYSVPVVLLEVQRIQAASAGLSWRKLHSIILTI